MNKLDLYQSYRDRIIAGGTGGIALWSHDSLLGAMIKELGPKQSKLLSRKVNHASVLVMLSGLASGDIRIFNYESLEDGFHPHYLSNELKNYDGSVFWLKLKEGYDQRAIEDRIFKYDSTPYGYKDLLRMAYRHPDIETSEMICSESTVVVVTGATTGKILAPGELPDLGCWEAPIQIL